MTLNVDFTPCHSCKLINLDLTSGFHQPLWHATPHATSADGVAKTGAPVWLCDCHCTLPSAIVPTAALNGGNAAFLRATAAARVPRLQSSWFSPPALTLPQPPPSEPPPWSADLAAEGAVVRL